MQLFYAPDFTPPAAPLPAEESRHCVRVLRLSEGEQVWVTDGRGTLYECRIERADPAGCMVRAVRTLPRYGLLPYRLTLAVAPTKNADRFEWLLEKGTEVGVHAFVPLLCEHSERRVYKPERGEKIVTAAMKQSVKAYRPAIEALTAVREVIERPFRGEKLIAHCRPEALRPHLMEALAPGGNALLLIGPEGDFSPEEIDLALANGFRAVSLGQARLRTETAALAAAVMVAALNRTGADAAQSRPL